MVLKIGHRGACGYEPENTLLSFQKAIELGADMVELDVHLSKDQHPIVIHDVTFDRTTTGKGKITQYTLKQIKKFRTKEKNQPIPTLQEILVELKGKVRINIEIKGVQSARQVAELVLKNEMEQEVIVSSSRLRSLKTIKNESSEIETALIYYSTKTRWGLFVFTIFSIFVFPVIKQIIVKRAKYAKVDYLHLYSIFATKRFVTKLHQLGFKVNVWTVNSRNRINKMIACGVDGIFSNYPDRIKP